MILTCDECQTRYLVPGHAIGEEGRRVRCTNCSYEWFQEPEQRDVEDVIEEEPEDIEPIPEAVKPVPEGSELPVIPEEETPGAAIDKAALVGYGAAGGVFVLILGVFVLMSDVMVKVWPSSLVFYDLVGVQTALDGENLIFDQLSAVVEENDEGITVLTVKADILNLSREQSKVPYAQTTMIAADGQVVDSWLVEPQQETLEKEGELAFETTYPDVSSDVKEVNVKFIVGSELKEIKSELPDKEAVDMEESTNHTDENKKEILGDIQDSFVR